MDWKCNVNPLGAEVAELLPVISSCSTDTSSAVPNFHSLYFGYSSHKNKQKMLWKFSECGLYKSKNQTFMAGQGQIWVS